MTDIEPDPMLELFRSELTQQLAVLREAYAVLADAPTNAKALAEAGQALHTIRGASRICHLDAPARLAIVLDAELAAARAGTTSLTAQRCNDSLAAVATLEPLAALQAEEWNDEIHQAIVAASQSLAGESEVTAVAPAEESPTPICVVAVDHSLVELFREEVRSHAAGLNGGLLQLEREPTNPQRIEPLMRAAHSLKGAARIVGLDPAVKLAHEMEDAFVAAQAGRIRLTSTDIDLLLQGADVLAALADEDLSEWQRKRLAEVTQLSGAISGLARGESVAALPPTPVPVVEPVIVEPVAEAPAGSIAESAEAVVRVTAQSLNRLMSLAGESLVQARWLQPFTSSLLRLKKHQDTLTVQLDQLAQRVATGPASDLLESPLADARQQLNRCRQILGERIGEFENHAGAAEDLNSRLYREVIVSRMRPFSDGAGGFPRLVRDTARRLGKQARLDIHGLATEVDRDILDKLEAPLTHLLRNAVDHGLESTERRAATGKPAEGVIRINVRHRAGMLAIDVGDDGGGIDIEVIRRKIADRKLATADMAARMNEAELLEFLFLPGFSTAAAVTETSGRGVGLDVVQDTLRKIGGSVNVTTRPGAGTTFHLSLPITLSVVRAVLVEIAGEPYAFPHNRINRLLRVARSDVHSIEHRQFVSVDGQHVGLVLASQLLDLPAGRAAEDHLPVVLLSDASGQYGLIVDTFRGEQDLVVRPLDPRLGKVPNLSAAAILDDGSPVLIADVEDMIRSMDQFIQSGTLQRCDQRSTGPAAKKRILVVDDSITVREVQRQILRTHGYEVEVAVDGQDGWNKVRASSFDLVVSDIDMPRMGGLEFVRRIREDGQLKQVPVIIVSYKDRPEDKIRGLEVGANAYLTKSSFHDHTFLEAVTSLVGKA
ncbi:MAG: response regulator [Gemmataceae bacterium]|nr:response regulator [Gemmataceae bacterium]